LKLFYSGKYGIDLECKSPSFRFSIVFLEHINLFSSKILPFTNRLLNPLSLRNSLSKELKEGRFPTTDVPLNSEAIIIGSGLGIDEIFRENLILISR
jgi:hypothetical protein